MPGADIQKLWEERKSTWARMMEIGAQPESEERNKNFEKASSDLDEADKKLEAMIAEDERASKYNERSLQLSERMAKLSESVIDPSLILPGHGGLPGKAGENRTSDGKFLLAGKTFNTEDEMRAEANIMIFRSLLKHGPQGLYSLPPEVRAMTASDYASGGAITAPKEFMQQLIQDIDSETIFIQLVDHVEIEKAESLGWPTLDSDFSDYTKLGERETAPEDNLTFGHRELKPTRFGKRVKVSRELLIRAVQPIDAIVRARLAAAAGRTKEKKIIIGSGSNEPLGFMTPSTQGVPTSQDVAAANASDVDFDSAYMLTLKLPESYRAAASFFMNPQVVAKYRLKKATDNSYLWQDSISAGGSSMLHGYPVKTSDYMPGTVATGLYTAAFANLKLGYIFADAYENFFKRAEELYLETNEIGYFSHIYFDGMPQRARAIARLKQP